MAKRTPPKSQPANPDAGGKLNWLHIFYLSLCSQSLSFMCTWFETHHLIHCCAIFNMSIIFFYHHFIFQMPSLAQLVTLKLVTTCNVLVVRYLALAGKLNYFWNLIIWLVTVMKMIFESIWSTKYDLLKHDFPFQNNKENRYTLLTIRRSKKWFLWTD